MKLLVVGRKVQRSSRVQQRDGLLDQLRMVSLNLESSLHLLGGGERGRVEHDQIIADLAVRVMEQPLDRVRADHLVCGSIEIVEAQVARCPVEIGARGVHRGGVSGATRRGVDGERARISEQIEEPLALRLPSNAGASQSMVQEQPAVQVVPEVDPELKSLLGNGEELTGLAHLLVLLGAPDLGGVYFREDLLLRDSQNVVHRWNDPLALNGGGSFQRRSEEHTSELQSPVHIV